jgi:hypothetical protein
MSDHTRLELLRLEKAEHEMTIWDRLLPHPQDGTSDLRHLKSLAALRLLDARTAYEAAKVLIAKAKETT